ncbi:MAG: type II toxin-antitoxin system RelE/ParE family toxin [Litorimonas sp.]
MRPNYRFAPEAETDLERLADFMDEVAPDLTVSMIEALFSGFEVIAAMPGIGRSVSDMTALRQWPIKFGRSAYIALYEEIGVEVIIARVYHSREDRP